MSEVTPQTAELLNTDEVARTIVHITHQVIEKTALDSPNTGRVVLLDIPSGGVPLAEKLVDLIEQFFGTRPGTESPGITLHRDDLRRGPHRALQPANILNSGIDGTTVVLADGVFFLGRTIRAVFDVTADIGRLWVVQLVVLADRDHRQLPIHAGYVGKNLPTSRDKDADVLVEVLDGRDAVILTRVEEQ